MEINPELCPCSLWELVCHKNWLGKMDVFLVHLGFQKKSLIQACIHNTYPLYCI